MWNVVGYRYVLSNDQLFSGINSIIIRIHVLAMNSGFLNIINDQLCSGVSICIATDQIFSRINPLIIRIRYVV